jgi:hypothetical protein
MANKAIAPMAAVTIIVFFMIFFSIKHQLWMPENRVWLAEQIFNMV